MRKVIPLLGLVFLIACGRGNQDKEAVRKAVEDRLAGMGMPPATITVELKSVDFKGDTATANVSIVPKGNPGAAMNMPYNLKFIDNKWTVTGRSGNDNHGTQAPASGMPANPHGGGMDPGAMPAGGGGAMPSPHDLPPVKKSGKQP